MIVVEIGCTRAMGLHLKRECDGHQRPHEGGNGEGGGRGDAASPRRSCWLLYLAADFRPTIRARPSDLALVHPNPIHSLQFTLVTIFPGHKNRPLLSLCRLSHNAPLFPHNFPLATLSVLSLCISLVCERPQFTRSTFPAWVVPRPTLTPPIH